MCSISKNRIGYIDVAKGLGMFAIIWGHICCKGWSNELVYSFHIPLFFFISGMLFDNEKYNSFIYFIKCRAKRLLIPYFVYSVVTWFIWAIYCLILSKPVDSYWMPLAQTFIAKGSGGYLVHNVALWFVPCLFVVELLFYIIRKTGRWGSVIVSCSIALLSIRLESIFGREYLDFWPWNIDSAFMALPFYSSGNLIGKAQDLNSFVKTNRIISFLIVCVLTVLLYYMARKFGAISMGHSIFGNEWIFHLRGLLGCFSTLLFSMWICSFIIPRSVHLWSNNVINYLRWTGENSFDVMATNNPIKGVICTIIARVFHIKTNDASFVDIKTSFVAFVLTVIVDTFLVRAIILAKKHLKNRRLRSYEANS